MNKYYDLIEYLKAEYLGQKCGAYGDTASKTISEIMADFEIKVFAYDEEKLKFIKKYEIRSKSDDACWRFILVPASILYSSNMEPYQKELIEKDFVQGIFTLKNSFFKMTTFPTAVIVLGDSKEKTWLTSAITTDDVISLFKDITTYKHNVYYTERLNTGNFMPEYYNGEINAVDSKLDKYETKTLQDIADIINGKNANRDHFIKSFYRYTVASILTNEKYRGDALLQKQYTES